MLEFLTDKKMKKQLWSLIIASKGFGLTDEQIEFPLELVENHEFGEAVHILAMRIYELDVEITGKFYEQISELAAKMQIDEKEYAFIKEQIKN